LSELVFDRSLAPRYGVAERLSARIGRVLAPNPGPFTFHGTGVYIVGAGPSVAIIDPGPDLPEHVTALERVLEGRTVSHILITHTHRDHSPAAAALKAFTGAKTYGYGPHPQTGEDVEAGGDRAFVPDVIIRDGDRLSGAGFTLECVHTPGHISNHLCFALRQENALFTGDHVMGWSTSVVAPPDGNMADYMRSLDRLIDRRDAILYPTHGSPISHPEPFLRALRDHRRLRAGQIRDSVAKGDDTVAAMVARLYPDIAPALREAASAQVRAHLEQMREEGEAVEECGRWALQRLSRRK
jgi:glyoxylase-like metal-dependent hydrolase (beta-lactamase superfamily II)